MAAVRKLVLVTSKGHPLHKYFTRIAEEVAKRIGAELEVREEDYIYLSKYGETDDLGLTWLPQLLAELDDGSVVKVLTQPVLDSRGKLDYEGGLREALGNIEKVLK